MKYLFLVLAIIGFTACNETKKEVVPTDAGVTTPDQKIINPVSDQKTPITDLSSAKGEK